MGKQVLFLQGYQAGILADVSETPNTIDPDGFFVHFSGEPRTTLHRVSTERDLFAAMPLGEVPPWCPPFDIRTSFVIDEVAVWFCNQALIGGNFHWHRDNMLTAIQVCWQRKIAISGAELSAVMIAHGLPSDRQAEFQDYFDFGTAALVNAAGRKPIKKWRQPSGMREEFAAAMRLWGR